MKRSAKKKRQKASNTDHWEAIRRSLKSIIIQYITSKGAIENLLHTKKIPTTQLCRFLLYRNRGEWLCARDVTRVIREDVAYLTSKSKNIPSRVNNVLHYWRKAKKKDPYIEYKNVSGRWYYRYLNNTIAGIENERRRLESVKLSKEWHYRTIPLETPEDPITLYRGTIQQNCLRYLQENPDSWESLVDIQKYLVLHNVCTKEKAKQQVRQALYHIRKGPDIQTACTSHGLRVKYTGGT